MARVMQTGEKTTRAAKREALTTIPLALSERVTVEAVDAVVSAARSRASELVTVERADILARYAGGLPAEQQSCVAMMAGSREAAKSLRRAVRVAVLGRTGRRIDLGALMSQRRPDGQPAWAVVDPHYPIGAGGNGKHDLDGTVGWPVRHGDGSNWVSLYEKSATVTKGFLPLGMPALPPRVRALATDRHVMRRAKRIGVLYQPDAWREVDPDPALVVEWRDLPGEYYALAVWGVDGPAIMEFVD